MFNKFIARNIGFPLQDMVMKTSILKTQKELLKSQFWNRSQMEEYRYNKLKALIEYAYKNVPYYRDLFKKHSILPTDIKKIDDIKKIPILTKNLLRDNQENLISEIAEFKYVKKGKTGGTTGSPLTIYKDTNDRSYTWASYYRWYDWMGIKKEDKVLTFWGTPTVIKQSNISEIKNYLKNRVQNNLIVSSFNINEKTLPLLYQKLISFNPVLIKGYLSAIINLAVYMRSNNLKANSALKAISSTTETLLPLHRTLIESVFKVEIYDQYGCGEVAAIAYECKSHKGLHITEEHVIVEVLDESDKNVIDQTGKITLTSLDNYVMPLIRYQNEDLATLDDKSCACGVTSGLIKSIEGRSIDTIRLSDGSNVHGVFFTSLLYELGITSKLISRFQIEQLNNETVDIRLESSNNIPIELLEKIKKEINSFVKVNELIITDNIPSEPNGKFRYIKANKSISEKTSI